jgi:hypothetical protein
MCSNLVPVMGAMVLAGHLAVLCHCRPLYYDNRK